MQESDSLVVWDENSYSVCTLQWETGVYVDLYCSVFLIQHLKLQVVKLLSFPVG